MAARRDAPSGRKQIAFGAYGGKFSHLDRLLPLLPECHHNCEPFAGSAAVLLDRLPAQVEKPTIIWMSKPRTFSVFSAIASPNWSK